MRSLRRRRLALALVLVALTALLTLAGTASSSPRSSGVFKRYYLRLDVFGEGLAQSLGKTPLADGNGIDTSVGEVQSRFGSTAVLAVDIDPRSGRVKRPWPEPGYDVDPFHLGYEVGGAWKGAVGDTPDAIGTYSCSFVATSEAGIALPELGVFWTFAGAPTDGKIPVAFGVVQPREAMPGNPKVSCTGTPVDHGYPGEGTIQPGVFMDHLTDRTHIVRIPVKPLLANLTKRGHGPKIRLKDGDIVEGQCGGCPLPMTIGDVASFTWILDAQLFAKKP